MTEPMDPMDERLRAYADRWRDAAAPAAPLDVDRLGPRTRARRTWFLVAASAAAVAVVIAGGTRLVGDDTRREPPPPADTTKPHDTVVPWAPLPATHPQIPTTTTTPSPDPAEAAGKPACRASDLHATDRPAVAAGTYYQTIRLTLAGDHPCRLEGWPDVELLDRGAPVDIPLERARDDSVYRGPVLVSDGQPALLQLAWSADWCAAPVHNDTIRLNLPGGSLTVDGLGDSNCYGTPGDGHRQPVELRTFEPVKSRDAVASTAYADVDVTGALDLTAAPDDNLDFVVTLTSPQDLVLDPCPDFQIIQTGDAGPETDSHALNCAAVPHKDEQGRPYLPAGTPVRFAMHANAGEPGIYKLTWVLDTVDQRSVGGTLTVSAAGGTSTAPETRDDALRRALAADPNVVKEMLGGLDPQGPFVCALHVMGTSADRRTFYVWLGCGDYAVVDGAATEETGSGEPAVVQVRGSGTDIQIQKVTFPRQQSLQADIKRLFPASIAAHIYDDASKRMSPSPKELEAEAVADATG